jgi:hypothetical protein
MDENTLPSISSICQFHKAFHVLTHEDDDDRRMKANSQRTHLGCVTDILVFTI